jgi:hypothetical protein
MALRCDNVEPVYIKIFLEWYGLHNISDNSGIPQLNNKHINPLGIPVLEDEIRKKIIAFEQEFDAISGFNEHSASFSHSSTKMSCACLGKASPWQ